MFTDNHCTNSWARRKGLINGCLYWQNLCATKSSIRCNDYFAISITDSFGQCLCRESTKYDRMDCANSRAGKHSNYRLKNKGHIETHSVSFFDTIFFEHIGEFTHLIKKFLVGDLFRCICRQVRFPIIRNIMSFFRQVPIETVLCDIELTSYKPLHIHFFKSPLKHRIPWFFPEKFTRLFCPKILRIVES